MSIHFNIKIRMEIHTYLSIEIAIREKTEAHIDKTAIN